MSSGLADNVKKYRRTAGLNQEQLAEAADLSVSTVQKVEQGGDARTETLHALARALGVTTAALFATEVPAPVVGDESNRQHLAELRSALMPPVGLTAPTLVDSEEAVQLSTLRRGVEDGHALYWSDRYAPSQRSSLACYAPPKPLLPRLRARNSSKP